MSKFRSQRNTAGLTLIEIVIYLGILVVLSTTTVTSIIGLMNTYKKVKVVKQIERSAVISMDRMTHEIRNAVSVDVGNSVLNMSPGTLQLNTLSPGGAAHTVKFSLAANGIIRVTEDGVDRGPLSSARASTTNLVFRLITTPHSQAVKIDATFISSSTSFTLSQNFYDTVLLRGSY